MATPTQASCRSPSPATTNKLQEILRTLARGGAKFAGRLADSKLVLAQRLAHWLNRAIDAGRAAPGSASDADEGAAEGDFDEHPRPRKAPLVEHAAAVGEMPESGVVAAEQAESALGRTMATELDQGILLTRTPRRRRTLSQGGR